MFIDQKAQDISLALIKVSVYMRRPEFRHRMEKLAIELVELASLRDFGALLRNISAIEGLINFGRTIYEIEPVNANILIHELGNLRSGMSQIEEFTLPDLEKTLNIESIFSKPATLFETIKANEKVNKQKNTKMVKPAPGNPAMSKNPAITDNPVPLSGIPQGGTANPAMGDNPVSPREISRRETIAGLEVGNPVSLREISQSETNNPAKESGNPPAGGDDNPAKRETAIVQKIRQSGDKSVQFKDIIAALPDFSERTLRYDLQRLCSQGVLEKLGPGGPATYYKIRVI